MIDRLSPELLRRELVRSVRARKPYCMIRMGDGEFAVMKYPTFCGRDKCIEHIGRWFDPSRLTEKQILQISKWIAESCCSADLLGIPSGYEEGYPKWARLSWYMKYFRLFGKESTIQDRKYFHFYLIMQLYLEGTFHEMLKGLQELYCITCRPIGDRISKVFGVPSVEIIQIPAEEFRYHSKNSGLDKYNTETCGGLSHHFDVRFQEVCDWIGTTDIAGKVFLVGAGGLGKIYCMLIKQRGGLAYDIGALFDGWAGLYTRPYLGGTARFSL